MSHTAGITAYEQALVATERLLRQVGEQHWADWLQKDLTAWRESKDVSHHRRAYGGMGSFNDVILCRQNQHHIAAEQEPWANSLFEWLKAVLFYLSERPTEEPTVSTLYRAVGRDVPSLSAFIGGKNAPDSMRGFAGAKVTLSSARCLRCGYARMTTRNIDTAIAEESIPALVFQACADGSLTKTVDEVLKLNVPGLRQRREELRAAATASDIRLTADEAWMSICHRCKANDTAIYHWTYVAGSPPTLQPSSNNLPLRTSRP